MMICSRLREISGARSGEMQYYRRRRQIRNVVDTEAEGWLKLLGAGSVGAW